MTDDGDPPPDPTASLSTGIEFPSTFSGPLPPPRSHEPIPATIGRYQVVDLLGRGGLGVVYRGYDPLLKRTVAIKMIRPGALVGVEQRERFRVEAEAGARLDHPNIIRVYEVGEESGQPYLVLEYVEGPTLAQRLAGDPLSVKVAAELVEHLARALAHAHTLGIVHRDLKPANVLLRHDPESSIGIPKVTDFGIAKDLARQEEMLTETGSILGTPQFMAPEQAAGDGRQVGPTADIWALGVILYECLTGRLPFRGVSILETIDLVRNADPVPPRSLQPGLPRDLDVIVLKCLRKDPAGRYRSAEELADDLQRWRTGRPIVARPVSAWTHMGKWVRRNPTVALILTGAILIPLVAALAFAEHNRTLGRAFDQISAEKTRTAAEAEKARLEKERADENYRHARDALRKILIRSQQGQYEGVPRIQELRKQQAEQALAFYRAVVAARTVDADSSVRFDTAVAEMEAGSLAQELGQVEESRRDFSQARTTLEELHQAAPDDRAIGAYLVHARLRSAALNEDRMAALAMLQSAETLVEELLQHEPNNEELLNSQANVLGTIGSIFYRREKPDLVQAESFFRRSVAIRQRLLQSASQFRDRQVLYASAATNLATCLAQLGRGLEAIVLYTIVDKMLVDVITANPDDFHATYDLGMIRVNQQYFWQAEKRYAYACDQISDVIARLERLHRLEPDHANVRDILYRTYGVRSQLQATRGNLPAAQADAAQCLAYASKENRRIARWELARFQLATGDLAGVLATLDPQPQESRQGSTIAEWGQGAQLAAKVAMQLRARAAIAGTVAAILLESAEATAVRLLACGKATGPPFDWGLFLFGINGVPEFRPLTTRSDFQLLRAGP